MRAARLVALLLLAGCASWDATRTNLVRPVNALVHHDYARRLRAKDLDGVAALFTTEARAEGRADADSLIAGFDRIDHSRCVIHDATAPRPDGSLTLTCELRLDGLDWTGQPTTWTQEREITVREADGAWRIASLSEGRTTSVTGTTRFREEARARGLVGPSHSRGIVNRNGKRVPSMGSSGIAVRDVDGDGNEDVLLVSGDALRLFRVVAGRFLDVTASSGIVTPPTGECRCAYFADIDNDGDADLFVGMHQHEDLLFRNDGAGHFQAIPRQESGLLDIPCTNGACFGDFDRDGDLDLVVVHGNDFYVADPEPPDNARNGNPDQYYRNDGTGRFQVATAEVGLGDTGWGLACSTCDYDRDGDLDLFIANDVGRDNLYRNRGDGTFEDVTVAAGVGLLGSSMSVDFTDVNDDGWPDLYISGMASNSRWLLRQPGFPVPAPFPISVLFRERILSILWEMFHGNRLYLSQGDGTFREVSEATRTFWLGWAWTALFLDHDNDGDADIYGVNGFLTGEQPDDG